ncbi:hypothetical protein PoB_000761900 [Plakobranchus ocellatus]|uniref:Uncharacterized protein n=1 Tax=Plakobranchus ocellatus TaxID=259542 RepID=A0AAV3YGF4_9GAST|nr:hypothetical protein PoB_000761900 [Plakobranchus ocellatus]
MENCVVKYMLGIIVVFTITRGLQVQSSPSATLCRVCDTHDPTVQDDCYQTVGKRHQVCTNNCITRFTKASSGLRIQKSCADDAVCISEWWEHSSINPDCQRSKLTDSSATLSPGMSCSVCCNSATGNDIYCSDDIFPQNSSLLQYPGVDRRAQTVSSDQVKNDSATSSAPMQSYSKQEHVTVGDTDEYPQPMICANCPNIDQKSSSSCGAMIRCYGDKPLCMTSFFDDGRQNLLEVKRCAAVSECWDLWYNKTRLRSACMGDINNDPYSWTGRKSGECHYCCHTPRGETTDWCNKAMWPTKPKNLVDMIDYAKSVLPQATTTVKNEPSTTAQPTTAQIIPSTTTTTLSSTSSTTEQATTRTTAEETRTTEKATTAEETTKDEIKTESTTSPQSTAAQHTKTRQTSPTTPETTRQTTLDQTHEETTGMPFTTIELENKNLATTTTTQQTVSSTKLASYNVTTNNPNVLKISTTRIAFSTTLPTPLVKTNLTTNASTYTELTPTTNSTTTPDPLTTASETTTQEHVNVSAVVKSTTTSADDISTTATTTKTATATTTQPTTATTTQAAPATTTQATTSSSTTIKTTPAALQPPVPPRLRCESCNDAARQGQLCQSGRIEFCPDDKGYCLNTIDFSPSADGSKSMAVSKK